MIVLDTNVVSELLRAEPSLAVFVWVDRQPVEEFYVTATTLAELVFGAARLPEGRRRRKLEEEIESFVDEDLDHQVLPFGESAAAHYADIVASRERLGRPISVPDAQIAAVCRLHKATLATRNIPDFLDIGLTLTNPWST